MLTTAFVQRSMRLFRSSRRFTVVAALLLAPLATVLALPAGPASATSPSCDTTVTTNVKLTADLNCTNEMGLTIGKKNITINLNGHTISGGTGGDGFEGIYADSESYGGVTIENGTIDDFGYDIYIEGGRDLTLKNLTLDVDGTGSYQGVYLDNVAGGTLSDLTVKGDISSDYPLIGVQIEDSAQVSVSGSTVVGAKTDGAGFYEQYSSGDSYKNDTASGIYTTYGNDGYGFEDYGSSSVSYTGSSANHDYDGFYLHCDTDGTVTAKSNTANDNDFYGFDVYECYLETPSGYDGSVLGGNTASDNQLGYYSSSPSGDNYAINVRGNTFNSNSINAINSYDDWGGTFSGNTANDNDNDNDGMYFYYAPEVTITSNTTNNNYDTGIYLYENYGVYQATDGAGNTADTNGDYGLDAGYAVPDTGAVNMAHGNTVYDCYNWVCQASVSVVNHP